MRSNLKIELWKKYIEKSLGSEFISFTSGRPSSKINLFYFKKLNKVIKQLLKKNKEKLFDYSPPEGLFSLRQAIGQELKRERIAVSPQEVIIINGAQQGINLVAQLLLKKQNKVLVEKQTYLGIEKPFTDQQAKIFSFPQHLNELKEEKIGRIITKVSPRLIYLIPDFANPTGKSLTLEKRKLLVKLAKKYHFLIIEDQTYRNLVFEKEESLPSIRSLYPATIALGTVSKIIVPGLRIGWLIIKDKKLWQKLALQKEANDLCPPRINQEIIARLLTDQNCFKNYLDKIRAYYQEKMNILLLSLEKYMPKEFSWNKPQGGFFVWVKGPKKFDSRKFFYQALKNKVNFMPGFIFYYQKPEYNTFRLSISGILKDKIEEGIKRLAKTYSPINN